MYDKWNLEALYSGCDDPKFVSDSAKVKELVGKINALAQNAGKTEPLTLVKEYLTLSEQMTETAEPLFNYLFLRQSVNAKDEEAGSQIGRLSMVMSEVSGAEAVLEKEIGGLSDLDGLIASDPLLGEYSYLLSCIREDSKHLLGGKEEEILSKLNVSGGDSWSNLRDYLTSSVQVDYRGEKTTLSDVRNLAYSGDADVRKDAYDAEIACYDRVKDAVAFSLNSIKMQAITESELRGFSSPLEETLFYSRMKKETLDALLSSMVEYMPVFRKYLKAKAKLLGHEKGLPWYDLFAPVGSCDADYTPAQAREYLVRVFSDFDGELASMIDRAFAEDWIDFFPREGKQGGAFCEGVRSLGQSRVLTNYGGKFTDVMTLAHELGHAFHNQNILPHRPLNNDYSMPVAETASNFNEVVVMDYALGSARTKEEKLALLEGKLSDTTQIICDIYSRYLFEKSVFESRKDDFMFPDRLCALMLDAQKEAYGDGLDPDVLHPYMWVCKSHYYSAGLSYYNWPYAFGGLFAQGLFAKYKEEGKAFVPLYKKLLYSTPVCSVEDTAKIAGIDLTDPVFWKNGLAYFAGMVEEFCTLVGYEEK